MLLGSFDVPEIRLVPNIISDIKLIYDSFQLEKTKSSDLASTLGYKHATASRFYLRLKALTAYGLLEGRNNYRVSELGKSIAYSEGDTQQKELRTKAILNVSLWSELYKKYKKLPPKENFWIQIKNITGMEPKKAQSVQAQILKWYLDDVAHVQDNFEIPSESIRLGLAQENQMVQQMEVHQTSSLGQLTIPTMGTIQINDSDTLTIARTYLDVLEKKIKEPKVEPDKVKNIGE